VLTPQVPDFVVIDKIAAKIRLIINGQPQTF